MKPHTIIQSTVAALMLAFTSNTSAQRPASSASAAEAEARADKLDSMNISFASEAISLPIAKAGELQRKGLTDAELYKQLLSTGKQERLLVLRTKSGQRTVLENVTEYRYPVDFNLSLHPIPQPFDRGAADEKKPVTAAPASLVPQAFEKRDVGDTMEAEPTLSPDAKVVNAQIVVSHVALAKKEKWGQGVGEFEQPQFETQRLSTNFTASVGSSRFIGTLNPPFGNGVAARAEQNVWFCFITTTIAPNNSPAPKKVTR